MAQHTYSIVPRYKTVERHCKASGHSWTEYVPLAGFWVSGGFWCRITCMTLAKAKVEVTFRQAYDRKHQWKCPVSQGEARRCHRLGIEIDTDRYELLNA